MLWSVDISLNISYLTRCLDISENEFEGRKQVNLELDRTSAKTIQVSGLTIGMVIFNVDMCPVVLHVSYILICVNCLWIDMLLICYVYVIICELFNNNYGMMCSMICLR